MRTLMTATPIVTALMLANAATGQAAEPAFRAGYVFTSFRGDGDGLHLAYSEDGVDWTDLGRVFLKPTVGSKLVRDPNILLGKDGLFHMVWTSGWGDKGIGYATSKNLIDWSEQSFLPLMEKVPGTRTTWAPELYHDDSTGNYVIVWSSNVPKADGKEFLRAYYTETKDFKTFTDPKILFDPGFNNLDTTIINANGKFAAVFKEADDQPKGIWGAMWLATADKLTGPYTVEKQPVVKDKRIEGPALLQLGAKTLMFADYYADHRYGVFESTDLKTWSDITPMTHIVRGQRHGSIVPVSAEVMSALREPDKAVIASVPKRAIDGFAADPSIRVFGDTYYLYPTSDKPNWNTTDFSVWSSKNLIDWKHVNVILDVTNDLAWAKLRAWAPDCIERDGKFFFYFCADAKIGVGIADKPTGPFKDALGKPMIKTGGKVTVGQAIDPAAFIDDDGQAYLYYGNVGRGDYCQVVKLKPDMVSIDGDPINVTNLKDFREGIWVFKRQGKYYFMWSIDDARSPDYRVGYGMSDSPLGPVKIPDKDFIVLRQSGRSVGTAHHSVVNVPGTDRWYVAYHRHAVPNGSGFKREVVLARMEFNADGTIKPMDPSQPAFAPGSDGEPLTNGRGRANAPAARP